MTFMKVFLTLYSEEGACMDLKSLISFFNNTHQALGKQKPDSQTGKIMCIIHHRYGQVSDWIPWGIYAKLCWPKAPFWISCVTKIDTSVCVSYVQLCTASKCSDLNATSQ